jgi:tartrate-resistant acid phosphatase type 5
MIRLAAALAAVALLSGANGCCACAASRSYERRGAGVAGTAPALTPPVVRVLHFGDFGEANCQQGAVAAGIAESQRLRPFDLALHVGDNLYDCGPDWRSTEAGACAFQADQATVVPGYSPPSDPTFREKFEDALHDLARAGVPVYLALGNHDVRGDTACVPVGDPVAVGRAKACLEVAHASPVWKMPARHYVIDRPPARFIVLDTNVVAADYGGFTLDDEVAFLTAAAADCAGRVCFVAAHHPPATAGTHASDFTPAFTARMARLVAAGGSAIRGWLVGHDHDLQHLRTAGGLDVFVSGNGCRDRVDERFAHPAPAGATLLYGSIRWGHAVLDVSSTGYTWRVEDAKGSTRYCCAATLAGSWSPCEPASCD